MKKILRNIILIILLLFNFTSFSAYENDYTRYRDVDISTFKEFGFKMTKEFFNLKNYYEVNWNLNINYLNNLENLARKSINYLPDDIKNESYYNELITSIQRWKKSPDSEAVFVDITKKLSNYLTKVKIWQITWKVTAIPSEWNAPLVVTLKADVIDPEWTLIPENNYVWWIDLGGKKKILGNWPSINYTFREEWKYSVFCDVRSNHKNKKGYTDVLSFRWKADINVLSKIASVIVKVNWETLWNREELKFTPDEARYWLIFDATSTVPSWKAKIIKTSWDFGNWIKRSYNRWPKVERVSYFNEGTYKVKLEMETNLWDIIKKEFTLFINDPIATINVKPLEWYLWDKFTFSAKTATKDDSLTYNWEIVDIVDDKVIFKKQGKTFIYSFPKKWYFNVKLKVSLPYENTEDIDSKVIYISSRAPEVNFTTSIPKSNKPNRVLFDASNTFDPDYTDNWKLKFSWLIDWEKVKLKDSNKDGSVGYYTFNSIWEHSITLEVTDPDNVKWIKTSKVKIDSILSVDFTPKPRVIKRWDTITFKAESKEAVIFEWDFWDGTIIWWEQSSIKHTYERSWKFNVTLRVEDVNWNKNSYTQTVYVGDWEHPVAILNITSTMWTPPLEKNVCKWEDAYIVNRVDNVVFNATDSIDVTWKNSGLDYSIKINNKLYPSRQVSYRFDELGCFPVKLTVSSQKTWTTDSKNIWVKVINLKPTLSWISINILNPNSDPVIVEVQAIGAKDRDWVITSYLWYYYTDIDSEPQDFRITTSPSTKFVLPKITWNYYFVVVLTDENWVRVTSEELWKKASITLAWDNINVPLVELNVNDSSVYIWEEVVFTVKVKNILWRNITSKSKFYWDFDGDWFYDQESSIPTVSHTYEKSWTFFVKLKVKHKWFSNTRTIEINVANRLSPDFKYISIWNTFLFISTSKWLYDSIVWDLWDGTKVRWKETFKYIYQDNKASHLVTLKLIEWTKIKTKKQKVTKNLKNLLKVKKHSFVVLSYPEINEDGKIILKEKLDYVYLYPSFKGADNVGLYAVDTNADFDSDLNWWKDDDEDIKSKTQNILKVKLNDSRVQKIVVFVKDKNGVVLDSKNIIIEKEYVKISNKDISEIKFINLTEAQKKKIEYIKEQILIMPSEYKLKSLMYLQKLQEEWADDTEKTKVILEFEWYLDETDLKNKDELINILEWLLVEWEEDKSEKNVAYIALKNLVPDDAICEESWTWTINNGLSCRDKIIEKLDAIKTNNDIELNKQLAKEILASIVKSEKLSTDDKFKFKAILSTLVYWWVKNIPDEEKQEIVTKTEENTKEEINNFWIVNIFKKVWFFILIIFWFLLFITWIFFIIYKISNKDKDLSFSDFILRKTQSWKIEDKDIEDELISELNNKEETKDILDSVNTNVDSNLNFTNKAPDWLKWVESSIDNKQDTISKTEEKIDIKENWWEIPSWLKWDLEWKKEVEETKKDIKETNKQETKEENLSSKWDLEWKKEKNPKKEDLEKQIDLEKETSLKEESWEIPNWLKDSLIENKSDSNKEEKLNKDNEKIPDWLKWDISENKEEKTDINKEEEKKKVEDSQKEEQEIKKTSTKRKVTNKKWKTTKDNEKKLKKETKTKKTTKKSSKEDDLWDDGMEIPDWLKSE